MFSHITIGTQDLPRALAFYDAALSPLAPSADEHGPDALPAGQKIIFQRDHSTGGEVNALRAGVQFANKSAQPRAAISEPTPNIVAACASSLHNIGCAREHGGRNYDRRISE